MKILPKTKNYLSTNLFSKYYLLGIVILFFLLLPLGTIMQALHYGYYFLDLGTYAEKITRISFFNWNPFMPNLGVNLFNDHFNPIIIILSPLTKIFTPYITIIVAESVMIIIAAVIFYQFFKKRLEHSFLFFSTIYLLFNYAMVLAIDWPIHPETFAIPVLVLLAISHIQKKLQFVFIFIDYFHGLFQRGK